MVMTMKVYKCDACGKVIKDPYEEKMKEFDIVCEFDMCGVFPRRNKNHTKVDLCEECYRGLHLIAKAEDKKVMPDKAEWWLCEGGGYFCSHCGCFFDDAFATLPMICEKCNSAMTRINMEYEIDTSNKLVIGLRYAKEDEIPHWLKKQQRSEGLKNKE